MNTCTAYIPWAPSIWTAIGLIIVVALVGIAVWGIRGQSRDMEGY